MSQSFFFYMYLLARVATFCNNKKQGTFATLKASKISQVKIINPHQKERNKLNGIPDGNLYLKGVRYINISQTMILYLVTTSKSSLNKELNSSTRPSSLVSKTSALAPDFGAFVYSYYIRSCRQLGTYLGMIIKTM